MLINELIRDYLEFNNYHQTLSVFLPETGQPAVRPFDRATLASELQVTSVSGAGEAEGGDATTAPLLYSFLRPQSGVDDR
jgi:lisH domain-containing protein FOPNL|tara:strand:- start:997 stop:1236 length:240 start_codon:yes stop_codon:yes gene_type:complete